jgi:hypothetical protein
MRRRRAFVWTIVGLLVFMLVVTLFFGEGA